MDENKNITSDESSENQQPYSSMDLASSLMSSEAFDALRTAFSSSLNSQSEAGKDSSCSSRPLSKEERARMVSDLAHAAAEPRAINQGADKLLGKLMMGEQNLPSLSIIGDVQAPRKPATGGGGGKGGGKR